MTIGSVHQTHSGKFVSLDLPHVARLLYIPVILGKCSIRPGLLSWAASTGV